MFKFGFRIFKNARSNFDVLPFQIKHFNLHPHRKASSFSHVKPRKSFMLMGILAGAGVGVGYTYYNFKKDPIKVILNPGSGEKCVYLQDLPDIKISRQVKYVTDSAGLKLILFQYPTCPFCCKVRAFLDANGLSYDVVEVNPVLRQQLNWTDYKKVPILLVKSDKGYLQLNDSSMIISTLSSYLHDAEMSLAQVADFYPTISYVDDDGSSKKEILNKYFLMYRGVFPQGATKESIEEERKWRKWTDEELVHMLSPNVYRTKEEALQAFTWFSHVGEWDKLFPTWEQYLVVYVGAFAMWMIGKRLKKRHNLKEDVRESLYDSCNKWVHEVKNHKTLFHGGSEPNLADLAVYGVLTSIEGCTAFTDLLEHTKISPWFSAMKAYTHRHPHV